MMELGSRIVGRCLDSLANQATKYPAIVFGDHYAYFIAPHATGEMRTDFITWDYLAKKGKWVGQSGSGASRFVPKTEHIRLVKNIPDLAEKPTPLAPELYHTLVQLHPKQFVLYPENALAYAFHLEQHPRQPSHVAGLWQLDQRKILEELMTHEANMNFHSWQYRVRTNFWRFTFPTDTGAVVIERLPTQFSTGQQRYLMPEREKDAPIPTLTDKLDYDINMMNEEANREWYALKAQLPAMQELQKEYNKHAGLVLDATLK